MVMTDNVQSAMFENLKVLQRDLAEIKSSVADLKLALSAMNARLERVENKVDQLDARVERLEKHARAERTNAAGILVMMRSTAGAFDVGLTELEDDVGNLQAARQS
jgi:septal ring factor EnvC (AmiA/AmiB activator)